MGDEFLICDVGLVELNGRLMKTRKIRVEVVDIVEKWRLVEKEIQNDLGKQPGQDHTLWFGLVPAAVEWWYGYTICCCIRRDRSREGTKRLVHKGGFHRMALGSFHTVE